MINNKSLSTFFGRFKRSFEACRSLGVAGLEDKSDSIVRQFYSKLDGARYAALYWEKVNLVNQSIDAWPISLLADVEWWIPPKATDTNFNRPTNSQSQRILELSRLNIHVKYGERVVIGKQTVQMQRVVQEHWINQRMMFLCLQKRKKRKVKRRKMLCFHIVLLMMK